MSIVQSLWIGGKLSNMEILSIKSFLDNGNEYHLYIYDKVENIPKGTIVKNGEDIISKDYIFKYSNGSYSAFSNLFRFYLLHKKGNFWVDTDIICTHKFDFTNKICIFNEPDGYYKEKTITSCVIKLPKNSILTYTAVELCKEGRKQVISNKVKWGLGLAILNELVKIFNLKNIILDWRHIMVCGFLDWRILINSKHKCHEKIYKNYNNLPQENKCIHLWNEMWRRYNIDKNKKFDSDSLYEYYKKKHKV